MTGEGFHDFRGSKMRRWGPRKRLSDLPTNRAMIRVVRHDQTERLAPHKICEYLACSPGTNVLVVECSGGNSRPSCPSGVGGGTLGNRKISSSVAGQSQDQRRHRFRMSWWERSRLKGVDRQSVNGKKPSGQKPPPKSGSFVLILAYRTVIQVARPQRISWVKCHPLLVLHIGLHATGSIARS